MPTRRQRCRAIAMAVVAACVPYLSIRCIDPSSCPTSHVRGHEQHHEPGAHHHAARSKTPDNAPPAETCCELTGKFNVVISEGPPSITPLLSPIAIATASPTAVAHIGAICGALVLHTAHSPPAYLQHHTLLI